MLMRNWIVRCNRRVKNPYPLWWRSSRFARCRDQDARRYRQRNKPPPKNLTARFTAINLEHHLPTVSPQEIPSGRHEAVHTFLRRRVTQHRKMPRRAEICRLVPFLPSANEWAFHRRRRKQQILPVCFGTLAHMRIYLPPCHLRTQRKEPLRHAQVRGNRICIQPILKSVYVDRHNPHSPRPNALRTRLTVHRPPDVQSSRTTGNSRCAPLRAVPQVV